MTTKTLFKNGEKVHVQYHVDHGSQVYRIEEVVQGGDAWSERKIWENHNELVNAIHYGYSDISDTDTDNTLTLDRASYAELFTMGMAVESTKTDFRGTVAEIRYHENRRYVKVDWPTVSIWYNEEQVFSNLLVA